MKHRTPSGPAASPNANRQPPSSPTPSTRGLEGQQCGGAHEQARQVVSARRPARRGVASLLGVGNGAFPLDVWQVVLVRFGAE